MTCLEPTPDREIRHQKAFFERLAGRYADGYGISLDFLEGVRRAVSPHVRGRVLDIGNGGLLSFDLTHATSVAIADLCSSSLKSIKTVDGGTIRGLSPAEDAALQCVEASAMDLPFAAGSFDVVAMCYVAHHLSMPTRRGARQNIGRALGEVHRVLADGGTLVLLENCPARLPKLVQDLGFSALYRALHLFGKPLPYFMSQREILRQLADRQFAVTTRSRIAWSTRVHQPMFPGIAPPGWLWERLLSNRMFVAVK